ncbi:hypothetical protein [Paraliomyxa miuraensis]|uniref:hypothetical protein n=1 Tax=Paraliomyxa miuraensis TaxID=376150 RepID=UPI00225C0D9A|nr:hypothetical protein [Paraliomyxa miuraensis]MCX4245139.1 hypothetical protein [Paraliomyxa miuraensis]
MAASSSPASSIFMGSSLTFRFDESSSTLDLIRNDGSVIGMWGQTLLFAFAPQQTSVALIFQPVGSSYGIDAQYQDAEGNTTPSQVQGRNAVITISGPPSIGTSFEIMLGNSNSTQSAIAMGPSARLQIRLVFTTAEPPPDPDAGPIIIVPRE